MVATSAKTPFSAVCSADGRITVVADLSLAITSEGVPAQINLLDKNCRPKEMDGTRALFSFPINGCGSTVELGKESVTYKNEIIFSKELNASTVSGNDFDRVTIQCTYALAGLLSVYRFQSDAAGVGRIVHSAHSTEGLLGPTIKPTTMLQTLSTQRHVSSFPNNVSSASVPGIVSSPVASMSSNVSSIPGTVSGNISSIPGTVASSPGTVSSTTS
ncbi:hypothetical protein FQN60_010695, partial [Etheostoma spectabile]